MSPGRQLALAALVALAAFLMPERAFAALLPACEAAPDWTTIPTPPQPICEVVTSVDEETGATTKVAPICDPRGASAIAPQRILPVEDSRIESTKSCKKGDDRLVGVQPDRRDGPPVAAWVLPPATISDGLGLVPPAFGLEDAEVLRPSGEPRRGVTREVYHPPR